MEVHRTVSAQRNFLHVHAGFHYKQLDIAALQWKHTTNFGQAPLGSCRFCALPGRYTIMLSQKAFMGRCMAVTVAI